MWQGRLVIRLDGSIVAVSDLDLGEKPGPLQGHLGPGMCGCVVLKDRPGWWAVGIHSQDR